MAGKLVKVSAEVVEAFQDSLQPEMVGRNCRLKHYKPIKVPTFSLKGPFIAFASPDSTYAVTKQLLDDAKRSILIGIYDFTAGYIKELLLRAMRRGVKISLMLDLDNRSGETEVFEDMVKHGCKGVPAPSCASDRVHYFASSHEKVIVIDNNWSLVQSGNWTENSIPQNERDGADRKDFVPGNRDMGLAVESRELASFFTRVLRADMKLELDAEGTEAVGGGMADLEPIEALQAAPSQPPIKLFPSKRFSPGKAIRVTPILSPDNYMEIIPGLLETAERSIDIEEQYIRGQQPHIQRLLGSIQKAVEERPKLKVRVILASPFPGARFKKEAAAIIGLKDFGLRMGTNVRILNPKHFVHCHNKLIIVDNSTVLISSQNWSDFAVTKNREAGLLVEYPDLARYYAAIFETDWDTGKKSVGRAQAPELFRPEALSTGKTVPLRWGDYAEV